ncbi:hypothetical protein NQ318_014714 [Aromia moschata]|uniref:Uncharacterized protein n=1 Tax=Aromia moschata TaxID=1265417 RepID=A0AAV8ZBF4_9CUCU|nr:hypothetical protein NQ318_014714 [Aromia moschata]
MTHVNYRKVKDGCCSNPSNGAEWELFYYLSISIQISALNPPRHSSPQPYNPIPLYPVPRTLILISRQTKITTCKCLECKRTGETFGHQNA